MMPRKLSLCLVIAVCCLANANAQAVTDPHSSLEANGRAESIPDDAWKAMDGKSWRKGLACPRRTELTLLHLPHIDFDGAPQMGRMIVSRNVADEVIEIFSKLYMADFRIQSMRLVDEFGGDDDASMAANNTSAFNCRLKTAGRTMSEHAFGKAIDVNPVQNPYVSGVVTSPKAGAQYNTPAKRAHPTIGLIQPGGVVVKIFAAAGWKWGGNWKGKNDYQHFSKSGR